MSREVSVEDVQNPAQQAAWSWQGFIANAQTQAKELVIVAETRAKELAIRAHEFAEIAQEKALTLAKQTQLEMASRNSSRSNGEEKKYDWVDVPDRIEAVLDLTYITENIVSMAFPQERSKISEGGNDINEVVAYLTKNHRGHFMIWNISEDSYDYSKFENQVLEYKFPGHPSPPLGLLFKICTSVESWLDADERNVAVIHCLTGKGRTASLLACVLAWIGEFASPMEALQYVSERKSISAELLTIPSQRRYVQYFSNMLDGVKPRSVPLLIRRIIMNSVPIFGDNGEGKDNEGCCPYLQLFKGGRLIATSVPTVETCSTSAAEGGGCGGEKDSTTTNNNNNNNRSRGLHLKWIASTEGSVSFQVDVAVQGDILLRCRHADSSGARVSMYRAAFHTGYAPNGVLRLTKTQLDGSNDDPRFHDDFFIDIIFAPIEKTPSTASSSSSMIHESASTSSSKQAGSKSSPVLAVGTPSDSGLFIDSSSSDKYELTLHRDTRFWDTVTARKSKAKKRRARKFVASANDPFSISDDGYNRVGCVGSEGSRSQHPAAVPLTNTADLDLIMLLAEAERDDVAPNTLSSTVAATSTTSTERQALGAAFPSAEAAGATRGGQSGVLDAVSSLDHTPADVELRALEELERELGLDESSSSLLLDLPPPPQPRSEFTPTDGISPAAYSASKSATTVSLHDDDNLDELERYLESLSTGSGSCGP